MYKCMAKKTIRLSYLLTIVQSGDSNGLRTDNVHIYDLGILKPETDDFQSRDAVALSEKVSMELVRGSSGLQARTIGKTVSSKRMESNQSGDSGIVDTSQSRAASQMAEIGDRWDVGAVTSTTAAVCLRKIQNNGGIFFFGQNQRGQSFITGVRYDWQSADAHQPILEGVRQASEQGQVSKLLFILPNETTESQNYFLWGIGMFFKQILRMQQDPEFEFYPRAEPRDGRYLMYDFQAQPSSGRVMRTYHFYRIVH